MIKLYYHIYADGRGYFPAISEHAQAINTSGLGLEAGILYVGVVGSPLNRERVVNQLRGLISIPIEVIAEADKGFEQVTMNAIDRSGDNKILYAHTKGGANPSRMNAQWRAAMTKGVVYEWEKCVELLDKADAVGGYWLPDRPNHHPRHFSGTFWWANSDYLRRLPIPVSEASRWEAEMWIGRATGPIKIYDLAIGNPIHRNWLHPLNAGPPPEGYEKFIVNAKILGYRPGSVYVAPSTPLLRTLLDEGIRLTRLSSAGYVEINESGGLYELND